MSQYINERIKCSVCDGSGARIYFVSTPCVGCGGSGEINEAAWDTKAKIIIDFPRKCYKCGGRGSKETRHKDDTMKCETCNGLKFLVSKKRVPSTSNDIMFHIGEKAVELSILGLIVFGILFGLYRCVSGIIN